VVVVEDVLVLVEVVLEVLVVVLVLVDVLVEVLVLVVVVELVEVLVLVEVLEVLLEVLVLVVVVVTEADHSQAPISNTPPCGLTTPLILVVYSEDISTPTSIAGLVFSKHKSLLTSINPGALVSNPFTSWLETAALNAALVAYVVPPDGGLLPNAGDPHLTAVPLVV
jgi:hypothetical protein